MKIVRHTRIGAPRRTKTLEVALSTLRGEAQNGAVQIANSRLRNEIGFLHLFGGHTDLQLADTISERGLVSPPNLLRHTHPTISRGRVAKARSDEAHHTAHRRGESRIGSDLLTLIRGERFAGGVEQLDTVLTLAIRASVVVVEHRLRARTITDGFAGQVVAIDATHDRVRKGASGNVTRAKLAIGGLAHGYQYTRRGRTLQTLLF